MAAAETRDAIDYHRIVVPLDGSAAAEQALPHAEAMAQRLDAPLHLVRVLDPTRVGTFDGGMAMQQWVADERSIARNYLERIEQDLRRRQHKVTAEYRLGPAAQELLAATQPDDLLVMATHGRSGLGRWFLGSVAEGVLHRATVPILLVRASDTTPAPSDIRRILIPLDGSPLAEEALPTALALAQRLRVPVRLLTIIEVSGAMPLELATAAFSARRFEETLMRLFAEAEQHLARSGERLRHAGVETSTDVRHGVPGAAIVAAAQPGDLIVMTSHGRTGPARWLLGSVAESVVRQATVPVLLLRTPPASDRPAAGAA
jgi:nucleotide-binding universal stress UspA family protein